MSTKQLSQLPQLFRSPFLRKVALGRYYSELSERLGIAGLSHLLKLRLADIFEGVYEILLHNYRCEYVFKNTLLQNWFSSRHSTAPSFVTDEFRVCKCRVDLAVFADTSVAFEIKTEFDSAIRLPSQSTAYMKMFDYVYIVTTSTMLPKLEQWIPKTMGILQLNESGSFKKIRDSESHANQIDLLTAFNCLRQSERISIVEQLSNSKINVPNSKIYDECKNRFRKLLPFEAHRHILEQIRTRTYPGPSMDLMAEVPIALKYAALTLRATNAEVNKIGKELKMIPRKKEETKPNEHILPIPERETERIACA